MLDEPLGRVGRTAVERDSEQVQPGLALGVADLLESESQVRRQLVARIAGRDGESHEERKRAARGDVDPQRLSRAVVR